MPANVGAWSGCTSAGSKSRTVSSFSVERCVNVDVYVRVTPYLFLARSRTLTCSRPAASRYSRGVSANAGS